MRGIPWKAAVASALALAAMALPQAVLAAADWSIVTTPNAITGDEGLNELTAVSCISSTFCVSVGYYGNTTSTSGYQGLAEHWDGTSWTIITVPSPAMATSVELTGVACLVSNLCMASGYYADGSGVTHDLVEQWDGSNWTATTPTAPSPSYLNGVSCWSAGEDGCMAVGTDIEQWTGGTWTGDDSTASPSSPLQGVSCSGPSFCTAVGGSSIQQWNGGSWSNVASSGLTADDSLTGVSCTDPQFCDAVGLQTASGTNETLVDGWDGSSWEVVPSPNVSDDGNILESVSCTSHAFCMASGGVRVPPYSHGLTLVEEYNGNAWTILDSANVAQPAQKQGNLLEGVSCVTAFCMSTGSAQFGYPIYTLAEVWQGTTTFGTAEDASIAYDNWRTVLDPTASGGSYRADDTAGATASLSFSGTSVAWLTHEAPDAGIASVTIDGVNHGSVDLYQPNDQQQTLTYAGLAAGSHRIVIGVTGMQDPSASGTYVGIDAFGIALRGGEKTYVEDTSYKIAYDSWRGVTAPEASTGAYRLSTKRHSICSLTFTGSQITWVTATGPSFGIAGVSIDGLNVATVDLYASSATWQVAHVFSGLGAGEHALVLTVLGKRDAMSSGNGVVVDSFVSRS